MQRSIVEIETAYALAHEEVVDDNYLQRIKDLNEYVSQQSFLIHIDDPEEKKELTRKRLFILARIESCYWQCKISNRLNNNLTDTDNFQITLFRGYAFLAKAVLATEMKDLDEAKKRAIEVLNEASKLAKTPEEQEKVSQLLNRVLPPENRVQQPNQPVQEQQLELKTDQIVGIGLISEADEPEIIIAPHQDDSDNIYNRKIALLLKANDGVASLLKANDGVYETMQSLEIMFPVRSNRESLRDLADAQCTLAQELAILKHPAQQINVILELAIYNLKKAIELDEKKPSNKGIEESIYKIKRLMIPDNALRMYECLDRHQRKYGSFSPKLFKKFKDALHNAYASRDPENIAKVVYKDIIKIHPKLADKFKLASLSNHDLLEEAKIASNAFAGIRGSQKDAAKKEKEKDKYCREVAGRLLRSDKLANAKLDIETKLKTKEGKGYKYQFTLCYVKENFYRETKNLSIACETYINKANKKEDFAYVSLVQGARNELNKDNPLDIPFDNYEKPFKQITTLRNNLYNYAKRHAPKLNKALEEKKNSPLSRIFNAAHAVFTALGCLSVFYLPYAMIAAYHSKQTKGTVFFTHAPEEQKFKHQTKKSFHKLGRKKHKLG